MSDSTGIPITAEEDVTYADVDDVNNILRSFDFTADTNPTLSQVEKLIENKTRKIEKDIPTSFRGLRVENLSVNAEPTSKQRRGGINVRAGSGHQTRGLRHNQTTEKWIKINLPHYFIRELEYLELKTASGTRVIDLDNPDNDDIYQLSKRGGTLRVDYQYFPSTSSGTAGSDRLIDARVSLDYTYGRDFIEKDIAEATAKLVVYDLINSDAFSEIRSDDDTFIDLATFTSRIREEAENMIDTYKY